ncbi:MFS family permease [Friedmanniella endophytica]|uniref:MFS family permease n=1 Tax=Microlunatus kandeliicorticis TaxID=1759536 RepID=A0A7W3ISS3_9ACTN|nr:MFS transporter [Microlunatus kandeliicorticis]MBA8794555.1 MFS family permease [Microlunatus kandeliicorticis]
MIRALSTRLRRADGAERLPREVGVLAVVAFCVAVGFGVVVPVLPVFARSFGVDNFAVGAVISAFALMRLCASPFVGRLIRAWGERVALAVGIGIVALSSGLAGLAATYPQLLVLRGIGGIGSALFTVSATSLLLAAAGPARRGRAAGLFQGGFLIGGMAGPAIGGVLAAISLRAPFFFYAATLAVAGAVGLVLLRSPARPAVDPDAVAGIPQPEVDRTAVPLRRIVADRRFQAACLTNLAQGWTSFGVRSALVPVIITEVLDRPASWTGIAFACAAVVQTLALYPAGTFVDRVGRRPAMVGAGLLAAVSIMAVALAPNLTVAVIALCGYGVAAAFLGTAPAAAVGDAGGARGGTAVAVFSMCSDAGAIVGPLVAGALADAVSFPVAFGVGAALLALAALNALRMPGGVPGGGPAPATGSTTVARS